LWDVDGYFVNFLVTAFLITNLSFLIRIIFVDRLFTQQLSGQAVSIIPELANVQELGIYKMITNLPSYPFQQYYKKGAFSIFHVNK